MPDFSALSNIKLGNFSLDTILSAILIFLVCMAVQKILMKLVDRWIRRIPIDKSLLVFLRSAVQVLFYVIIGVIVADALHIPVSSLVALLGVAGLAVSLAVQGALSNLAAGLILLGFKPFGVGDFVEVDGISGTVEEIGLMYTKVNTYDNKVIHLPNSNISNAKITNYTVQATRMVELKVGASYEDATADVKAALADAAAQIEGVLESPAPFIHIFAYQDSCIQYVLRIWVKTEAYWPAYFALTEAVRVAFDRHGVQMSYPHLNVHLSEPIRQQDSTQS